jgi:hypothetical protein
MDVSDRVSELQIRLDQVAGVASITAEICDDRALNGALNVIEREIEAVREVSMTSTV